MVTEVVLGLRECWWKLNPVSFKCCNDEYDNVFESLLTIFVEIDVNALCLCIPCRTIWSLNS